MSAKISKSGMNPITAQMLRDDWEDDPNLSQDELTLLQNLTDDTLQDALDQAFSPWEDVWFNLLDNVRSRATQDLTNARKELGA